MVHVHGRVVSERVASIRAVAVDDDVVVEIGVESAGHHHRPLTASGVLPGEWAVVELNPAHVTEQRRVNGKRGIKADQIDLAPMFDLLVAGRGHPMGRRDDAALLSLQAWAAMRFRRARLGVSRFRTFAANRDVQVSVKVAQRFVTAATDALPLAGADTARVMLAADLVLLDTLETQVGEADTALAELLPRTPFQILTTTRVRSTGPQG